MSYLEPPPFPAPVIVQKDVGGFVADYQAQTERYRIEGREVRLHECRSACTLALSLPGVCVYPTSVVKFHAAYDAITRERHEGVTRLLFESYPVPVKARLGELTRDYRILTGRDLILLGVRACDERVAWKDQSPAPKKQRPETPIPQKETTQASGWNILDWVIATVGL